MDKLKNVLLAAAILFLTLAAFILCRSVWTGRQPARARETAASVLAANPPLAGVVAEPGQVREPVAQPVEVVRVGGTAVPPPAYSDASPWGPVTPGESEAVTNLMAQIEKENLGPRKFANRLAALGAAGDRASVFALLEYAKDIRLGPAAADGLGRVRTPGARAIVGAKLRELAGAGDLGTSAGALMGCAMVQGDEAVGFLSDYIECQWAAPDGYELQRAGAAASALGRIGSASSAAALISQLNRAGEPRFLLDFGSAVVAALSDSVKKGVGQPGVPPADKAMVRAALRAYAGVLRGRMPPENNPPGRAYYEEKISEALTASESMGRASAAGAVDGGF